MEPIEEVEPGVYVLRHKDKSIEVSLKDSPIVTDNSGKYYPCNWKNFYGAFLDAYINNFEGTEAYGHEEYFFIVKMYSERYKELYKL